MNVIVRDVFIDLKSEENIRCDGKVFLEMYLKSYGFYNRTLVASQARDEILLYPNLPHKITPQ